MDPNNNPAAGRCGLLEGEVQTVPRAELRALLSILDQAERNSAFTVRVDASYLLGFRDDPMSKADSDNGDMWAEFYKLILSNKNALGRNSDSPAPMLPWPWKRRVSSLLATGSETTGPTNTLRKGLPFLLRRPSKSRKA